MALILDPILDFNVALELLAEFCLREEEDDPTEPMPLSSLDFPASENLVDFVLGMSRRMFSKGIVLVVDQKRSGNIASSTPG